MEKTLVIFDVDGTLVYSNRIDSQCFAETYAHFYNKPLPSIDWKHYPHVTDHTIFSTLIRDHFNREATEAEIGEFQDYFVKLLEQKRIERPAEFMQVPYARETVLRLMDDSRFVLGIGTGGWKRPASLKLDHVSIPLEAMHMSGGDFKETREDIINEVISLARALHENIKRIVYVGDALWDVQTTRRLTMNFIGIRRKGDVEVLKKEGAGIVLKDYSDFSVFQQAIFTAKPPE